MSNPLKHLPKIGKRDCYGNIVVKYIVVDSNGFNIGEFDTKVDAFITHFKSSGSNVFKFTIAELIK